MESKDSFPNWRQGLQAQPRPYATPVHHTLILDSRDRDRDIWTTTSQFSLKTRKYKNVDSVELLSATFPSTGVTTGYIMLQIDELDNPHDVSDTQDPDRSKMFAYLPNLLSNGGFITVDDSYYSKKHYPYRPHEFLNKWTLRFKNPAGTVLDFGTDLLGSSGAPDETLQTSVRLKVTTLDFKAPPYYKDVPRSKKYTFTTEQNTYPVLDHLHK